MDLSERQLEIIKASGKILMESGIAGLTTKNLAREMHFSESALYRHFKNKEAIVTLLIAYLSENITQRFDTISIQNNHRKKSLKHFLKVSFRISSKIRVSSILFYQTG